jgi:hypothetical protein
MFPFAKECHQSGGVHVAVHRIASRATTSTEQTRQATYSVLDYYHPLDAVEMHSKELIFTCLF